MPVVNAIYDIGPTPSDFHPFIVWDPEMVEGNVVANETNISLVPFANIFVNWL